MADYAWAVELAQQLLEEYGAPVTLRTMIRGAAPDPLKPHRPSSATASDVEVNAVFLDYEQKYIDGTVIQTGDQRVFMPSLATDGVTPVNPTLDAVLVRGSEKPWKIILPKPLAPAGDLILFELQVRQ